jgi:xylose dehydrogenase (NAD/NADP)
VVPAAPGHTEDDGDLPGPPPVSWGVLGATSPAAQRHVLPAIKASPKAHLVATASLSNPDGNAYETFGADRTFGRYEQLLDDPEVEAVYIPHPSLHGEWVAAAAAAGKHVLCERPLARTAQDAASLMAVCEEAGVLLMEAYMTPFHPRSMVLADTVRLGRLGQLRHARSVYSCVRSDSGEGALLELGVFCLAPLVLAARRLPLEVAASAVTAPSGKELAFSGWMDFGRGFSAGFICSLDGPPRQTVEVTGTEAAIVVDDAFTPGPEASHVEVAHRDGRVERLEPGGGDPYRGMIDHVTAVLRDSADLRWPPARSVELLGLMDRLRGAAVVELA